MTNSQKKPYEQDGDESDSREIEGVTGPARKHGEHRPPAPRNPDVGPDNDEQG